MMVNIVIGLYAVSEQKLDHPNPAVKLAQKLRPKNSI